MSIDLLVHAKFSSRIQRSRLKRIAQRTLRAEKVKASLTIYITTNAEIRKFNRMFHATDAPTDVLSFPSDESDYLGDIVISYDRAKAQAHDAGWRIADEIDLLAVHGILHLLGYDDLTPRKRVKMWQKQEKILGHEIRER